MGKNDSSDTGTVSVMVEVPKGSRNKYEYDKIRRRIKLDRMLFSSVHYPCDYGFVEDSLALDGDALDALVLLWEPTFPGCIIESKPLGMFIMSDEKGPDEKILCVPVADPLWNYIEELKEVPPHLLKEIEHFFSIYKKLEHKDVEVDGWRGIKETLITIEESKDRYKKALRSRYPMYE